MKQGLPHNLEGCYLRKAYKNRDVALKEMVKMRNGDFDTPGISCSSTSPTLVGFGGVMK